MRAAAIVLLVSSCTLGPNPEKCARDQQCRDVFGLGATCADDGLCQLPEENLRCASTYPRDLLTRPEKHGRDLVLGTLFDASTDGPQIQAAELAATQINDNIGPGDWLEGRQIGVVHCSYETNIELDDLDYVAAAEESANYLIDVLGVRALIGPATSDQSEVVYPIAEAADVVIVSPSATSIFLNDIDGVSSTDEEPGLFWRTAPPDNLQGIAIADDLLTRGVSHIAVAHQAGSYGTGLADVAMQEFSRGGGTADRFTFTNTSGLTDAIIDAANAAEVEEVLFISSEVTDIVAFLNGAEGIAQYTDVADPLEIFLTDAASDPILLESSSGQLNAQIRGTRPQVPEGGEYQVFSVAYNIAYSEDPAAAVFASFSYDATMLALYGAAWAHYNEPEIGGLNIARGLRQVSDASQPEIGIRGTRYSEGVSKFANAEPINLAGASGGLDFDEFTGETDNPIEVWVINATQDDFDTVRICQPDGSCSDVVR